MSALTRCLPSVAGYVSFLQRWKIRISLFWLTAFLVLGIVGATKLVGLCENRFDPPIGSPSQVAHSKRAQFFGNDDITQEVLYLEAKPNHSILENDLLLNVTRECTGFFWVHLSNALFRSLNVTGYYPLLEQGPPFESGAPEFISKGNLSSFLLFTYPLEDTKEYGQTFLDLRSYLMNKFPDLAFVGGYGEAAIEYEAMRAGERSIELMDAVSLPISFLILMASLQSPRLLLLPLLALAVSVVVSFGIMGVVALSGISTSSAAPPVMMSMLLAISVDYALFLLARFQEELRLGSDVELAVERMLRYSGHTILGSGFTLAFCFLSLLFFPLQLMHSMGIGVIVAILTAICANLSLVPICLLAMPKFFSAGTCSRCGPARTPVQRTGTTPRAPATNGSRGTLWDRWANRATKWPAFAAVLVVLLGLGFFGITELARIQKSVDTFLFSPRGALTIDTATRFGQSFSKGQTGPNELLLLPAGSSTVYDDDFWGNATRMLQDVVGIFDEDSKAHGTVQSILYEYNLKGSNLSFAVPLMLAQLLDPSVHNSSICEHVPYSPLKKECKEYTRTKNCEAIAPLVNATAKKFGIDPKEVIELCGAFQLQFLTSVAPRRDALVATVTPSLLPGSKEAVEWAKKCRELIDSGRYPHVDVYMDGVSPQIMDAIDAIYDRAPLVLSITMVCCLVFIGILTISVAFAFVSVALIGWTMAVIYGLGTAVYQYGLFGAGAPAQLASTGGLAWLVLPLTFTVVLGLGLDYNIFLLGRVCEYRCDGFGDREAIANGVARTGPVITSAGIIMAVAFSGLMLSDVPMLNQVSLLLVTAVLIDTFFVRSLATPALHSPLGRLNWWPRKVPAVGSGLAQEGPEAHLNGGTEQI